MSGGDALPKGWVWATVSDCGDVLCGQHILAKDYNRDRKGLAYITGPADFGHGDLVISKWTPKAKIVAQHDDVLITVKGAGVGKAIILNVDKACISRQLMAVRAPRIPARFLLHFFESNFCLFQRLGASSLIPGIEKRDLLGVAIPIPPAGEQRRIVAKIGELFSYLDAGVAALERAKANLKRYRAAVLKAAVEGKLTAEWRAQNRDIEPASKLLNRILAERRKKWEEEQLAKYEAKRKKPPKGWKDKYRKPARPDTSNLPPLSEGWCWAGLDQLLFYLRNGYGYKPDADDGLPILRSSALRPLSLNLQDVRYLSGTAEEYSSFLLSEGDLLFTRYSGNPSLVGICGTVPALTGPLAHTDKLICGRTFMDLCRPRYLEIALNTWVSRSAISRRSKTTAGQTGISGTDLRTIPVPLPPFAEQKKIVSLFEAQWSNARSIEAAGGRDLIRASRLRQSILKRAFEGKLVPQDPNDEPASVLLERIKKEREAAEAEAKKAKRKKRRAGRARR